MSLPNPLARGRAPRAALLMLACLSLSTSMRQLGIEFTSPHAAAAAAARDDPIDDVRQRLLDLLCLPSPVTNASALAAGADALQHSLRPNGTWADVDYDDPQDRALWRTYAHLERTATMIQAATWPLSPLYAQPSLFNASRRALLTWSELDPQVRSV